MNKKITRKIGIILLAALISPLLALTQTGNQVANADGTCSIIDFTKTTDIEAAANDMGPEELEDCIKKAKEKAALGCAPPPTDTCDATTASANALSNQKDANAVTVTIKNYAIDKLGVKDMFENQCIPDDNVKYSVVIEEVIESELIANENVINCMRNTLCVERDDKLGIECVTALRKTEGDGGCSTDAQALVEKKPPAPAKSASLYCQPVQVLRSDSGVDLLFLYIGTIYRWAASVIGIIAVLVIVISGIQISAAAGEQQAITNAKTRIFQSIGGLVLLFLSGIVLYTINPTFFTG